MSTDNPQTFEPKNIELDLLRAKIHARLIRRNLRKARQEAKLPLRYGRQHVTVNQPKGDGYTNHQRVLLNKARNQPR